MKTYLVLLLTFFCFSVNAEDIKEFNDTRSGIRRIGIPKPPSQQKTVKNSKTDMAVVTNAPVRTWTSNKETTIKAKLIGLSTILAIFEKEDGKRLKVKRNELSDTDQKYLEHYETSGEFPAKYTRKNINIIVSAASAFLLFAIWFVKGRKKTKYQTPKREVTIGTGL